MRFLAGFFTCNKLKKLAITSMLAAIKLVLKATSHSTAELTDSHVEEVIDMWNRKSRRVLASLGDFYL